MIVHGIPGDYVLEEGDIISIDCGAIIEGYHGDAAYTVAGRRGHRRGARLIEVTERSLYAGIDQMRDGNRLHDIGRAVQQVAEAAGFSVVRNYVGHAIGTAMHEDPQVPNYWPGIAGAEAQGRERLRHRADGERRRHQRPVELDDGWSVVTADGSLSAHFEHTIAITEDGPEVLTLVVDAVRRAGMSAW